MNNEMCGCGTEEKTSSAKGIVKINYKEDFELVVELLAGDKPYQLGDEDFRIDFIVMASRYTVGRTGGVCERCSVDGNKIRCFMDAHGLPPGELRAEVKVNTPDPNYAHGKRLNVAIAEGVVLLVKDNTRFDGAVIKAAISMMLIDAYDLAKAHGYKGTIDEYYATFTEIGHLKENIKGTLDEMTKVEKQRANAETERAKAETERQRKQDSLNTAEDERVKYEQQRQNNEGKREQAELNRFTAENYRASAEVERLNAEQQRNSTEQARQTAESLRANDERSRVGSEIGRTKAEDRRTQAEKQRQTDEELRKQAETKRVNAEEKRMSSEKERSTTFSSMQENINSKIKDVNAATSDLKSIIGMDKGVFANIDVLQTAYPSPQVGFSAKVGTEIPYAIYVCEKAGTWKDSGAKYTPTTQIPTIEQTIGDSETSVMSQKAVTEALTTLDASIEGKRYKDFSACLVALDASLSTIEKQHIRKVICMLEDGTSCEMNRISQKWTTDVALWKRVVVASYDLKKEKVLSEADMQQVNVQYYFTGKYANGKSFLFDCQGYKIAKILGKNDEKITYRFLSDFDNCVGGDTIQYAKQGTVSGNIAAGILTDVKIPSDAKYLWFENKKLPQSVVLKGSKVENFDSLSKRIDNIASASSSDNDAFNSAVRQIYIGDLTKSELNAYKSIKLYDRVLDYTYQGYKDSDGNIYRPDEVFADDMGNTWLASSLVNVAKTSMTEGAMMSDLTTPVFFMSRYLSDSFKLTTEDGEIWDGPRNTKHTNKKIIFKTKDGLYYQPSGRVKYNSAEVYEDVYWNVYTDHIVTSEGGKKNWYSGNGIKVEATEYYNFLTGFEIGKVGKTYTRYYFVSEKSLSNDRKSLNKKIVSDGDFLIDFSDQSDELMSAGVLEIENITFERNVFTRPVNIDKYVSLVGRGYADNHDRGNFRSNGYVMGAVFENSGYYLTKMLPVKALSEINAYANFQGFFYDKNKNPLKIFNAEHTSNVRLFVPADAAYFQVGFQKSLEGRYVHWWKRNTPNSVLQSQLSRYGNITRYSYKNEGYKEVRAQTYSYNYAIVLYSSEVIDSNNIVASVECISDAEYHPIVDDFRKPIKAYSLAIPDNCKLIVVHALNNVYPKVHLFKDAPKENVRNFAKYDEAYLLHQIKDSKFQKSVTIDVAGKYYSIANLKRLIDNMAAAKLNNLMLHFSNNRGTRILLDDMKISIRGGDYDLSKGVGLGYNDIGHWSDGYDKVYTQTEIDELFEYAKSKGITIQPSMQSPGKLWPMLQQFPQFRSAKVDVVNFQSQWALDFVYGIFETYAKYFGSKGCRYFNLCTDEVNMKINDDTVVKFADYVNHVANITVTYGMSPMMYNDNIGYKGLDRPHINKGIFVEYWNTRALTNSKTLQELGYQMMSNNSGPCYWTAGYAEGVKTPEMLENLSIHGWSNDYEANIKFDNPHGIFYCIWSDACDIYGWDEGTGIIDATAPFIAKYGEALKGITNEINPQMTVKPISGTTVQGGFMGYVDISLPLNAHFKSLTSGSVAGMPVQSVTNISCSFDKKGRMYGGNIRVWFLNTSDEQANITTDSDVVLNYIERC